MDRPGTSIHRRPASLHIITAVIGQRLGPYEVLTKLGEGGMGVVYGARDTKLGRQVALKVLPPAFASDAEYLARFDREGRLLASVNHPNIATLYGIEEAIDTTALVMELVDGRTLTDCILEDGAGRGLPVETVVTIARQIADAIAAAHERGIVHRDLKPGNIKITSAGMVKVLDFGLAKNDSISGKGSASGGIELTQSPTVLPSGTRAGMIMGTAAYMSPEQARGLAVDHRTDIWAFGCILFEMLAGRPPFDGNTVFDVIASILRSDPDWTALPTTTPAALRRVLRRCLAKDPQRRLHAMADVRPDIDEADNPGDAPLESTAVVAIKRDLDFQRITDFVGLKETPVVSPDGKMVAFVALVGSYRQIWIRLLAGGALLQLTRDDEDHLFPRWAPDSGTLIYFTPSATLAEEGTIFEIGALVTGRGHQSRRPSSRCAPGTGGSTRARHGFACRLGLRGRRAAPDGHLHVAAMVAGRSLDCRSEIELRQGIRRGARGGRRSRGTARGRRARRGAEWLRVALRWFGVRLQLLAWKHLDLSPGLQPPTDRLGRQRRSTADMRRRLVPSARCRCEREIAGQPPAYALGHLALFSDGVTSGEHA
jgi:serine/threonine protein kinase